MNSTLVNYWKPVIIGTKNRAAEAAKKEAKIERAKELQQKKRNVDPAKRLLQAQAQRAEKNTERNLIRSTKNSGRTNKDGDHVAANDITLDTKLQTARENPVVLMHELYKVGQDAERGGKLMGALVLRNKLGVGVVAIREEDFARLVHMLA